MHNLGPFICMSDIDFSFEMQSSLTALVKQGDVSSADKQPERKYFNKESDTFRNTGTNVYTGGRRGTKECLSGRKDGRAMSSHTHTVLPPPAIFNAVLILMMGRKQQKKRAATTRRLQGNGLLYFTHTHTPQIPKSLCVNNSIKPDSSVELNNTLTPH